MTTETQQRDGAGAATAADTLTITDNRTGLRYEVPINDGAIHAMALRQIKADEDDFGLLSYDPAFLNTASTRSAITLVDGDAGILRTAATRSSSWPSRASYLETAYLLLFGELPTEAQLVDWTQRSRATRSCTRTSSS